MGYAPNVLLAPSESAVTGLFGLGWEVCLVATFVFTHVTIAAVTIYLHRCQAHRALMLHPVVAHLLRFWLWLTTGMVTAQWVAVHRKHHAHTEGADDPHSPQVQGIKRILWRGAEVYRQSAHDERVVAQYSHGCPNDWIERNLYSRFNSYGIVLMLAIDLALFGVLGLTTWAIQMLWIPFFAAGVINGVGHWAGYRNFQPADASRNIVPWGVLIGGEELHNNHHAYPSSARFSVKWWELDIGWLYIRILEAFSLARVKKLAPRSYVRPGQPRADLETVRAFASARLQVMSHYARNVLKSVYRQELKSSSGRAERDALRSVRKLLHLEPSLMDEQAREALACVLARNQTLKVAIQYRDALVALWNEKTATPESLLQSLQQWCREAEATGIEALAEFATALKGYALLPAPPAARA